MNAGKRKWIGLNDYDSDKFLGIVSYIDNDFEVLTHTNYEHEVTKHTDFNHAAQAEETTYYLSKYPRLENRFRVYDSFNQFAPYLEPDQAIKAARTYTWSDLKEGMKIVRKYL